MRFRLSRLATAFLNWLTGTQLQKGSSNAIIRLELFETSIYNLPPMFVKEVMSLMWNYNMAVKLDAIPQELRRLNQWVVWRYEKKKNGRLAKVPLDPKETREPKRAKTNDPSTWASFEEAVKTYLEKRDEWHLAGIGFVFSDGEFVGIDLDNCRDPETGEIEKWAQRIIERVGSYAEVSPSGRGVKIIAKGPRLERGRTREMGKGGRKLEIYSRRRFFTITGWHLEGTPTEIRDATEAIEALMAELFPPTTFQRNSNEEMDAGDERLPRWAATASGLKFQLLQEGRWKALGYESHSEGDLAMCAALAHKTAGDEERIDELFRQSGLMRPKWDEVHSADGQTYGEMTIRKALRPKDKLAASLCEQAINRLKTSRLPPNPKAKTKAADTRTEPTDTAVLIALLQIAWRNGTAKAGPQGVEVTFFASQMDLAKRTAIRRQTVGKSINRLLNRLRRPNHLKIQLRRTKNGKGTTKASEYKLIFSPATTEQHTQQEAHNNATRNSNVTIANSRATHTHSCVCCSLLANPLKPLLNWADEDVFRENALGHRAWRILCYVLSKPGGTTEEEIRLGLDTDPRTIQRALERLMTFGFLKRDGDGYIALEPSRKQFEEIAELMGVLNRGRKQEERYEEQRRRFREHMKKKRKADNAAKREERAKEKKREAEAHPFTLTYNGERKADNAVKYVVISFSERRKQDRPDFIDLAADFEAELNIKTRKAQMSKEEVQFLFRYDGELEEKRWVFEEYGAEVVLRVGLPDLEEGKATKNEIAPLTPERFKAFISWLNERSRRTFSQR